MRDFRLLGSSALRSCALLAAGLAASPALAQPAQDDTQVAEADDSVQEPVAEQGPEPSITVTGSRIRRPNLEAQVPVTSIGGEEFFQQGQNSVGDTLNDLPALRSTFAQQNAALGVGVTGLNLLDLRGLGTIRTLVLVNGRRVVPADITVNASSPDVNTIPGDLIERVDVVTGGNSAVYGSDAIAGVVNFILRRDFEGIQVRGNAATSEEGFGANQFASILGGMNFAGGRGNITGHVEYARQERVYAKDIPAFRRVDGFIAVDGDSAGLPSASDGFPDNVFFRDIRVGSAPRFGQVVIPQPQTGGACGQGTLANNGPPNTAGIAYHCSFIFTSDGRMIPQTGTRVGAGPLGTFIGGNGDTGREELQLSILPFAERINANLLMHYEFSEAFEVFAEAKAVRIDTVGLAAGPTFINNAFSGTFDNRIAPRLDNPFLNPADRTTIANAYLASGCGFAVGAASIAGTTCRALTAAEQTAIANGSFRVLFGRNLTDVGNRDEDFRRHTYRLIAGVRGSFFDDWSYEVSGNYGKMEERNTQRGFLNRQRFLLSLDVGRNPVTGQIQCRSQFDPAARVGAAGFSQSAATLDADVAACVPYNVFGRADNSAAIRYFSLDFINRAEIEQLNFVGFVNGDSSQLFELPGGPVRFVLGAEYRRETAFNNSDSAADTFISNSVFLGDVSGAETEVKEAFGEIQIPLLRDTPFFEELTITGAGRVSDYSSAVGTVFAYNAGLEWAPIRDVRFRANYGRAVRAPNVAESGFPVVPNFANGFIDPCSANAIGANAIRSGNCTGQLSAAQLANLPIAAFSLPVLTGSNPTLSEETADSYTIGAVIQPRFIPGLSLTADYYDITVNNVIVTLGAQAIVNSCYDSPGLSSPLCNAFTRNLGAGAGPGGELPGQILINNLFQGPQNFAKRVRRGIDFELAYRTNLTEDIRLNSRLIYSHQFQNSNYQDPANPNFENRILGETGDPEDEFRWNVDLTFDRITVGYELRYIGPQYVGGVLFENLNPLNGLPPQNADQIDITSYPGVTYHDLRFDYRIGGGGEGRSELNFFFGVDNLLDQEPPLGTVAGNANTAIFNIRGRNYYAGFRARF